MSDDEKSTSTPVDPEALYEEYVTLFNKKHAMEHLITQVQFGARHPGTSGAENFRHWASSKFEALGFEVQEQSFTAYNALLREEAPGMNIIAVSPGDAKEHILFSAHWDSRAYADRDPVAANRTQPVPAANDGASGVAVLIQVAEVLAKRPLSHDTGVVFVLYDFEDQGLVAEEFALGSKYFSENIPPKLNIREAINLDMVGDRNLDFPIERGSYSNYKELTNAFWSHGIERFPKVFTRRRQNFVYDDHIHLSKMGVPSIDVIDFEYLEWHTMRDVPEACSPDSLRVTGLVTLSYLAYDGKPISP